MNTHVVTRSFEGPAGKQFKAGESVDASEWAHTAKLVEQRRLRPVTPKDQRRQKEEDYASKSN